MKNKRRSFHDLCPLSMGWTRKKLLLQAVVCVFCRLSGLWLSALIATASAATDDNAAAVEAARRVAEQLDWYSWPAGRLRGQCLGFYQEPSLVSPGNEANPGGGYAVLPIQASGRSLESDLDGAFCISGDVYVRQGDKQAWGDRVCYQSNSGVADFQGRLAVRAPGLLLRGSRGRLGRNGRDAQLQDASFIIHDQSTPWRGVADKLVFQDGEIEADGVRLTVCPPEDWGWSLAATKVRTLAGRTRMQFRGVSLRLGKIPVLYVPALTLPVGDQRQSGFLYTEIASGVNGLEVAFPYYFNMAPHQDATLTARLMSARGFMLEGLLRRQSRRMRNELEGNYLHNDLSRAKAGDRRLFNVSEQRWRLAWRHEGKWGPYLRTQVNFEEVSDDLYRRDFGTSLAVINQSRRLRHATLTVRRPDLEINMNFKDYQQLTSEQEPSKRVPEVRLDYQGGWGNFGWRLFGSYTRFGWQDSKRSYVAPSMSWNLVDRSYAHVRISGAFRYGLYSLPGGGADIDQHSGLASLDASLFLERRLGESYTHTLEPRLYYLWAQDPEVSAGGLPLFDSGESLFSYQWLFRENRFSGYDRLADANRLGLGLVSRIMDTSDGRQLLTLTTGTALHFRDRRVIPSGASERRSRDRWSPLYTGAHWRVADALDLSADWSYDAGRADVNMGKVALTYRGGGSRTVHLGYRVNNHSTEDRLRQAILAFHWPLGPVSLGFSWRYDLSASLLFESLMGLEYNDCCWSVRLYFRDYRAASPDPDLESASREGAILLQVALRGLGRIGSSIDGVLRSAIPGYDPE